ncbi:MAG: SulP family inorganic anion transporter, partial [Gammaproteobacteria bacterium]|nr:SulP family inorganic anion transporter [Gammaproteobacteria bacterium]
GLYTAMVTPIVAALFGSSLHLISGPTTAISIVVFTTISPYAEPGSQEFISMALTITFLAGLYQLVFGLVRMGVLVNFVSHTVVVGFTAGAAILIVTSQIKHVLGVDIPRGESFLHTWMDIWFLRGDVNYNVFAVAAITLVTALAIRRFVPKIPPLLTAMVVGSLAAIALGGTDNGIKLVGEIPARWPSVTTPDYSLASIKLLAPQAFAIALLGLIEAVSISRAIATKSNQRIDANQEFIGQGLSNIVGSFLSSYAGSGSFTRSGVNYAAGAKTPISALFAAFFLVLIVMLVAPFTAYLPVAAMGGVILVVAYNLIDFHAIRHVLHSSKSETAILLTTFFATLFLELEFAIYLGVLLSLVLFLARTSTPDIVSLAPDYDDENGKQTLVDIRVKPLNQCPQVKIIRIDMSVYFGSLNHIQTRISRIVENEKIYHILILGSGINFIDLSGSEMLAAEAERLERLGGGLYFASLKPSVYDFIGRSNFIVKVGNRHFFDQKKHAIREIYKHVDKDICANCKAQVFLECK